MKYLWCRLLLLILLPSATVFPATNEKWLKVQTRHFTVLTPGSEAIARKWAIELEQFVVGLQAIIPVPDERLRPVTVVLFRTDKALRPFKPLEKGKPMDIAGFFAQLQDNHAIALALDYSPEEIRAIIYHEAVHWYTSASEKPLPLWLDEGLAEVYATFQRDEDGRYSFGRAVKTHLAFVQYTKLMPLDKLTLITRGSLEYNEGSRATQFYAESWAFVHYLLFGRDTPGMASITRYLEAAETARSSADAFQKAFGVDYQEMQRRLEKYLSGGVYLIHHFQLTELDQTRMLAAKPASDADVELAFGVLLEGSRGGPTPESVQHMRRAADLAPNDPAVWQALGEAELAAKDEDAAAKHFGRAVDLGSSSYFAHYGLGMTRLRAAQGVGALFDESEAAKAAVNFRRSIELNPRFISSYEGLASLLSALEKPDPGDRAKLEHAKILAPESAIIDVGLAVCDLKSGQRAAARDRLALVVASTDGKSQQARQLAEALLLDDDWTQFSGRIETLFNDRQYAEVVRLIDEAQVRFTDSRYRATLAFNRRTAESSRRIADAVELANSGRTDEARSALTQLLAEATDNSTKSEVQRLLREIDKEKTARR